MATNDQNLLLCQRNAYLKEGNSKVLSCEKVDGSNTFKVLVDNCVLYPEGGGQWCDLGTANDVKVLKVSKPDKISSSFEGVNARTVVELETEGALEVNSTVRCVVDWKRRYDFMQLHSAQHLFSAVADKLFAAETVGWFLAPEYVTVDLKSAGKSLTTDQLQEVESEVNRMIRENKSIQHKVYSKEDLVTNLASLQELKSKKQDKESVPDHNHEFQHFRGEVKGAALQLDELRLVFIEGLDVNPCGGTHLSSLSEINVFKLVGTENIAGNILRVKFVAGQRALDLFQQMVSRESSLVQTLSVKPPDIVSNIDKLVKEKKELFKRFDICNEELAYHYGKHLLSKALAEYANRNDVNTTEPIIIFEHRYGADLKFLLRCANTFFEEKKDNNFKVLLFMSGDEQMPPVFTTPGSGGAAAGGGGKGGKKAQKGGETNKEATAVPATEAKDTEKAGFQPLPGKPLTEGPFVLFGEVETVNKVKEQVLTLLLARGGGKPGRLQGHAQNLTNLTQLLPLLNENV
jgi:misacylated tRNA(Ala) deacylase